MPTATEIAIASWGVALWAFPPAPVAQSADGLPSPVATTDPYTGGDPALLEAAGIAGYAPFALGKYHGTRDVDELLGGRVLWIETAHFKIGSTLSSYAIPPDRKQREKIRGELRRLAAALPSVSPGARVLDPWLRLHLVAMRVEDTYAEFSRRIGVTDVDFPENDRLVRAGPSYMGLGPYLGQKEKYSILLTERASTFGRFTNRFFGEIYRYPKRWNHGWGQALFYGTAVEFAGHLADDTGLHCNLVYNVVQNLLDGYKNFNHETPVWFKYGVAESFLRAVDPRYNNFDRPRKDRRPDSRDAWRWGPKVRALVESGAVPPIEELLQRRDYSQFEFIDYMVCWSLVDFLLQQGDEALATYLDVIKHPFGTAGQPPAWDDVLERQNEALRDAYELDVASLDAAWRRFVARSYERK